MSKGQIYQNFVCIGAQKAGTTTLADILSAHPDMCIPPIKETKFFLFDDDYQKGKSFYDSYFSNYSGQQAVGEFDPDYMLFPFTAQRLKDTLGAELKIIVVLRNPADRAYSHYLMTKRKGLEPHSFIKALDEERNRQQDIKIRKIYAYKERGMYGRQIEAYLQVFEKNNFLFLEFERDFLRNREETIRNVQAFLGVPYHQLDVLVHSNEAGEPIHDTVNELVRKPNFAKRILKFLLPVKSLRKAMRKKVIAGNMQKASVAKLDSETRQTLIREVFAEDILLTEKLTGLDLSGWYK